jgi:uncharacterized 2Fe-2S/4Fe-4S cluster protein (DUF4445 family)
MPFLRARADDRRVEVVFEPGQTVRQLLETTECRIHAGCSGNGACGLCRIRAEGPANPPTQAEQLHFGEEGLQRGLRLACQMIPTGDLQVEVLNPAADNGLHAMGGQDFFLPGQCEEPNEASKRPLGVAVDLGTTNVSVTVWDLMQGRRLGGVRGLNRQARYGADVLARVQAAADSPEDAAHQQRLALDTIGEGFCDVLLREGRQPHEISRLVLAGNTAQLALLGRRNTELLLDPVWWGRRLDCLPEDTTHWLAHWNLLPDTQVDVLPPLAGWVGSDALAGVLATGMTKGEAPALLVDFGTNSEIALWNGERLCMTSAAGGPAFEGCGLSCGMPAARGAVYAAKMDAATGNWQLSTIADAPARGLCGSGLVDIVAGLRMSGQLDEAGRFCAGDAQAGSTIDTGHTPLTLTKRDIDLFQRAKAAIATGVHLLRREAGCEDRPLKRLFVCGAFGAYLGTSGAQQVGLLPRVDRSRIQLCGNTSLAGCERLLTGQSAQHEYERLLSGASLINMAACETFDEWFIANLFLKEDANG